MFFIEVFFNVHVYTLVHITMLYSLIGGLCLVRLPLSAVSDFNVPFLFVW